MEINPSEVTKILKEQIKNFGDKALLRRELYGGTATGSNFINHLLECMNHLNFESCPAHPDVWMRPVWYLMDWSIINIFCCTLTIKL